MSIIKYVGKNGEFTTFQIIDFTHRERKYVNAVAKAVELGESNNLLNLPANYEFALIAGMGDDIKKFRNRKEKFIFVIDLTNFPFIACRIDTRDPNVYLPRDQFSKDIAKLWNAYDDNELILIVVNLHIPHTGLKSIDLEASELLPLL